MANNYTEIGDKIVNHKSEKKLKFRFDAVSDIQMSYVVLTTKWLATYLA